MKLFLLALIAASLTACSSSNYAMEAPSAPATDRQIQRTGSMEVKARSLKSSSEKSIALISRHNAIITSSSLTEDRYHATIRVPSPSLPYLMNSLDSVGKVTSKHVSMDDVTEAYRDLDSALKNKRALRDRLRSLLARATEVEDILKIETELSRVQTELDKMEARMKSMQSKISHSTLELAINRNRIPGPLGVIQNSTNWAVEKLFFLN